MGKEPVSEVGGLRVSDLWCMFKKGAWIFLLLGTTVGGGSGTFLSLNALETVAMDVSSLKDQQQSLSERLVALNSSAAPREDVVDAQASIKTLAELTEVYITSIRSEISGLRAEQKESSAELKAFRAEVISLFNQSTKDLRAEMNRQYERIEERISK